MPTPSFKVPPLNYTSRDYASIRDDLIKLIPFYTPNWTDHNPDDIGIVLLQLIAGVSDILHYYVDRNMSEAFIDTAITQDSLNSIWKLIDYTPGGTSPSTAILTFTVPTAATQNLTIPAGTVCQTSSEGEIIVFETDEDAIIAAGQTSVSVTATQGSTKGTEDDPESLGTSDGTVFQKFKILTAPTIDSSIRIFVDEGSSTYFEYFKVNNFDTSTEDDRVFKIVKDEDGFTNILFGDGTTGKVPPNSADVACAYRVGGGTSGNVGPDTITVIASSLPFSVAVTNNDDATGGASPDSIKVQKELGPLSLKSLNRAVSLEDYQTLTKLIEGVYDAYAYFHQDSATAKLAVCPSGGGLPSTTLKTLVQETLDEVNCLGVEVEVVDPTIIPIDVIGNITVNENASQSSVSAEALSTLKAFLSSGNTDSGSHFGTDINLSDVIALLDNLDGVSHVDIIKMSRDPQPILENWGEPNAAITISVASENIIEQIITVTMSPSTSQQYALDGTANFTVTGSVSGVLGTGIAATTNPSAFTPDFYQFPDAQFSITVDLPANSTIGPNDSFYFRIGKYLGNQTISEEEIADDGSISLTYTGGTA